MNERYDIVPPNYDFETDRTTDQFQDDMMTVCDLLDTVFDLEPTRSLQFRRAHTGEDHRGLEMSRQYQYDDGHIVVGLTMDYEQSQGPDSEQYTVKIAKTGMFSDMQPNRPVVVTYEIYRVSGRIIDGSVYAGYRVSDAIGDLAPIRPTVRPLMLDDAREICDICTEILRDANE